MRIALFIFLLIGISIKAQKIKGVNFVAEPSIVSDTGIQTVQEINAEWIAWNPYAFCDVKSGKVHFNASRKWKGETIEGTKKAIVLAHKNGLKFMVKPHIWLSDNSFTGK